MTEEHPHNPNADKLIQLGWEHALDDKADQRLLDTSLPFSENKLFGYNFFLFISTLGEVLEAGALPLLKKLPEDENLLDNSEMQRLVPDAIKRTRLEFAKKVIGASSLLAFLERNTAFLKEFYTAYQDLFKKDQTPIELIRYNPQLIDLATQLAETNVDAQELYDTFFR